MLIKIIDRRRFEGINFFFNRRFCFIKSDKIPLGRWAGIDIESDAAALHGIPQPTKARAKHGIPSGLAWALLLFT